MPPRTVDVTVRGKNETKPAFDAAHKDAEEFGAKVKESLNKPFDFIKGLFAVELARVVGEFFKSSVEAAAESESAWTRVGQAVANAGIEFSGVRGELKETFEQIAEKSRFSQKEVGDAFGTVLNITNNYEGSLKNLPLITDIAIAKQVDLSTAATIVGKVMEGQTSSLKRYGIVIADGADAMEELNKRFAGFAERDGASLQGRLHQVANEWEEVKIQMGLAITGTDTANEAATKLTGTLKDLAGWIERNRTGFREWSREFSMGWKEISDALHNTPLAKSLNDDRGPLGFTLNRLLGRSKIDDYADKLNFSFESYADDNGDKDPAYQAALKKERARAKEKTEEEIAENTRRANAEQAKRDAEAADKALTKRLDLIKREGDELLKSMDLTTLSAAQEKQLGQYAYDLFTTSQDTTKSLRERTAASDELKKLSAAQQKSAEATLKAEKEIHDLEMKGTSLGHLAATGAHVIGEGQITVRAPEAGALPTVGAPQGVGAATAVGNRMQEALGGKEGFAGLDESVGKLDEHLQDLASGSLTNFFDTWQGGIADVIEAHEKMGVMIPKVLRRAVGGALAADATDTLLRSAKAFALGLTDPTGIHLLQAGKLFAIGTAESAAAALMSGGGGGGGGGGYGGGVSSSGMSSLQSSIGGQGGPATIVVKGNYAQFDFRDPQQRDEFARMIAELSGNRETNIVFEAA